MRYIFVAGGVMSGVGKGIATSSIGKILQSRGYKVTALKIDPYVNVDAGTMNPTEHGEVFVLDDGTECDQDMGNYERFLNRDFGKVNYMTTGSVYLSVIHKERNLEYKGKQVEVVPRIPLEVIDQINRAAKKDGADIAVVEIGGTVGEYENILFLEAVRMLKLRSPQDVVLVLVSFLPALGAGGTELKTKPTQHAVRSLNSAGIHPDMILARAQVPLDAKRKEKIEFMCSIPKGYVVSAPNVSSVYDVPINFEKDKLGEKLLSRLGLKSKTKDMRQWRRMVLASKNAKLPVKIGVVGKYFETGSFALTDSYISVIEAIKHASWALKRKPEITWLSAEKYEKDKDAVKELLQFDGVIVPGGFGKRGAEGKISAIEFCRKKKIPYFGLCYGLQLACVEFARNVLKLSKANTTENDPKTPHPIIDVMPDQQALIEEKHYGGTMRLGAYKCRVKKGTIAYQAYQKPLVSERHRHRYELNNEYVPKLEKQGLIVSGMNTERNLAEIIELKNHPFFVGTQFHPELKSRPLNPHPLFLRFMKACVKKG
ncbi:MAG: CTP synthase [Candidatus Wildermuthbacteria bacterium RIFCSPLOWO2_01_FULL_47_18]|uniref:CTP synthase n=1 Tax=Candidatus Wildermuthbacteria bacterium RIFCSPLOWO2_01_FULL_47_18 TaxID=1802460 RepID=A0A1G2RJI4_9BACT|nr:MAG: CTP synthase [Candidatus Wildermuthbacteria bacterium RIFCSPLOWO2_01_FULL_47_18]